MATKKKTTKKKSVKQTDKQMLSSWMTKLGLGKAVNQSQKARKRAEGRKKKK